MAITKDYEIVKCYKDIYGMDRFIKVMQYSLWTKLKIAFMYQGRYGEFIVRNKVAYKKQQDMLLAIKNIILSDFSNIKKVDTIAVIYSKQKKPWLNETNKETSDTLEFKKHYEVLKFLGNLPCKECGHLEK